MMKHIIYSLFLVIFFASCGENDKKETNNTKDTNTVIVEIQEHNNNVNTKIEENKLILKDMFYKHFVGTIPSKKSSFVMDITCKGKGKLSGIFYDTKVNQNISFSGNLNKNGDFEVVEGLDGNITIKGNLKTETVSGTWTEGKKGVAREFEMKEDYSTSVKLGYFSGYSEFKNKNGHTCTDFTSGYYSKSENQNLTKLLDEINFPKQTPPHNYATFNETFKSNFIEEFKKASNEADDLDMMDWEQSNSADILYNHNGFLSYGIYYNVFSGGAHGSYSSNYVVIDIKKGAKLTIFDIFKQESKTKLSALIYEKIKKARDYSDQDMKDAYETLPLLMPENFYLTAGGIYFSYNPYEISSYANGADEVFVSYKEVSNYLAISL